MKEFFQFTASYEADLDFFRKRGNFLTFQFTASYEADPIVLLLLLIFRTFNSQPHTRLTEHFLASGQVVSLSIHSLIRG